MIFASPIFLFFFFPLTVIAYTLIPLKWRNALLLIASVLFYMSGSGPYILVIIGLTIFNSVISPNTYANLRRLLIVRRCIDTPKCGNYPFNR
jgi:alginate O-acetyltransferase complex protein AlgI